jgi:hypothetical protein
MQLQLQRPEKADLLSWAAAHRGRAVYRTEEMRLSAANIDEARKKEQRDRQSLLIRAGWGAVIGWPRGEGW